MDEENKIEINETELEEVSGGAVDPIHFYRICPKCKMLTPRVKTCTRCGAKL